MLPGSNGAGKPQIAHPHQHDAAELFGPGDGIAEIAGTDLNRQQDHHRQKQHTPQIQLKPLNKLMKDMFYF